MLTPLLKKGSNLRRVKAAPRPIPVRSNINKSTTIRNLLPALYAEQRFCVNTKLDLLGMYNSAAVLALDTQMLLSNLQQRIANLDSVCFEIGDSIYMHEQELQNYEQFPISPLPPLVQHLIQLPEEHEDVSGVSFVPAPLAPH